MQRTPGKLYRLPAMYRERFPRKMRGTEEADELQQENGKTRQIVGIGTTSRSK